MTARLLLVAGICIAIWLFFNYGLAHGEDNWTNCDQAYEFCEGRPAHRDCKLWTAYGAPLNITKFHKHNPAAETAFCQENRWHMGCGTGGHEVRVEPCPIPEKYGPVDGRMPWGNVSSGQN